MKVLVVGGGGREHAIAFKIAQNDNVEKVFCAPGNGGTELEDKCENVPYTKIEDLKNFALKEKMDLTVVGPEVYLVDGIVDSFKESGLLVFGPAKNAAILEGSKAFSKEFMKKYGVKTAKYEVFTDEKKALEYLKECEYPTVIKADGLAAGKGVVICQNYSEAEEAVKELLVNDIFKGAGKTLVVEEFLDGVEASILSITDGKTILPFISAKDHKNIFEGNKGPNTGGMGVISPNPYCNEEVFKAFREDIMAPTLKGINEEKMDYTGIIFFGLMITKKGVYLLEYNVRMGDPETQAVLSLMDSDFVELIDAALNKKLKDFDIKWKKGAACCVTAASKGYPKSYETGFEITGLQDVENKIFVAGAVCKEGKLLTSGGRVFNAVAVGENIEEAREKAYSDMKKVQFEGIYYRRDI